MDESLIKKIISVIAIVLSIVLLFKIIGLMTSIFFKVLVILIYAIELEGLIRREFSFFKPYYMIEYRDWEVEGDILGWEYSIVDRHNHEVASLSKEVFNLTDTYVIDVKEDDDALDVLMVVLAIDIDKCRSSK